MPDPDDTLVPPEDGVATGPTGTVLGDELSVLSPEATSVDQPSPAAAPVADHGVPVWAVAALGAMVLSTVAAWALINVDVEPVAPVAQRKQQQQPPPPPAPAPAKPKVAEPEKPHHERAIPVALPSKPPPPGTVKVFTSPDTHVLVDGKDYGAQPVTLTLPAGRNTVVLENDELPLKRVVTVEVTPAGETEQRFTFAKGWLRVAAPRGAKLKLDGKPMPVREVEVWEGNHKVDVIHADKAATHESQVAVVAAGKTTGIFFEPPRAGR